MSQERTFAQEMIRQHVTANECAAMRLLVDDDRYNQSEVAFMFEYLPSTVSRHVRGECQHDS